MTRRRTPRGFRVYAEFRDSYRNTIRVQQSSAGGMGHVWIFVKDGDGNEVVEHLGKPTAVSPHLSRAQAKRLIAALQKHIDETAVRS